MPYIDNIDNTVVQTIVGLGLYIKTIHKDNTDRCIRYDVVLNDTSEKNQPRLYQAESLIYHTFPLMNIELNMTHDAKGIQIYRALE